MPNPGLMLLRLTGVVAKALPAFAFVWLRMPAVNVLDAFELVDVKSAPDPTTTATAASTAARPASVRLGWRRRIEIRDMQYLLGEGVHGRRGPWGWIALTSLRPRAGCRHGPYDPFGVQ